MSLENQSHDKNSTELVTTFFLNGEMYGLEVMKVQEVTGQPQIFPVPLSPDFVLGLINLRGQLATAIGLKELFSIANSKTLNQMSVVCKVDGNLVSLMVDSIGDVIEAKASEFEHTPENMPLTVKRFIKGVYKMNGTILSLIDLDKLSKELLQNTNNKEVQLNNVS